MRVTERPCNRAGLGKHRSPVRLGGSRFAPVSNHLPGNFMTRWLNEKFLGLDRRRTPPPWRRETFARRAAKESLYVARSKPVTLFNDTFTNHYEPEIGSAAVEVLERGGCQVNIARPGCCGRPLIPARPA